MKSVQIDTNNVPPKKRRSSALWQFLRKEIVDAFGGGREMINVGRATPPLKRIHIVAEIFRYGHG